MRKLLLALLLVPSLASAQLVGGNANLLDVADEISPWNQTTGQWSSPGTGDTITVNYAAGPGTSGTQATRIQFAATSYDAISMQSPVYGTAGATYVFSIYARATSSGSMNGVALNTNGSPVTLTTTWTRYSWTVVANASTGVIALYNIFAQPMNPAGTVDFLLWGAKIESGTTPTGTYPDSGGTAAAPTASPAAGSYTGTQSVTLSCAETSPTILYCTTASCTPSTTYTSAISVAATGVVRAKCQASGKTDSAVTQFSYTITAAALAAPTFSPNGGTGLSGSQAVTMSCPAGATLHYTTTGATPGASDPATPNPVTLSATTTLKAYCTQSGQTDSTVASATFTFGAGGGGSGWWSRNLRRFLPGRDDHAAASAGRDPDLLAWRWQLLQRPDGDG